MAGEHPQDPRKRRGLLVACASGVALLAAACIPQPPPPPPPPPSVCASGGPESEVLTHAGGEGQEAATVPVVAVTEDGAGDLEVVTYGADDLGEAVEFAVALEADPTTDVVAVEADTPVAVEATATDPKRSQQWALNNVSFESAWDTANGSGTVIAVVDTGVRATHEDLGSKTEAGADFVSPGGGTGCFDPHGHGTHVAGIASASTNNGKGVAGGSPGSHIMPVRVLDEDGSGWTSDVTAGIIWAADHGADVINLSLGGGGYSSSMRTAVQNAVADGVLVVAASGNNNSSTPSYPGGYPEALTVASTTSSNIRSGFSNYGPHVDVAAPGSGILSTGGWANNAYVTMSGTSMATPYASAAAAVVKSACPAASANDVTAALTSTATDLGSPGFDNYFGHGLINPAGAVTAC
ncbi:MAG: S8 family serine peptidase [Acidimicrobiia bacterium]